LIDVLNAL